jgi:Tol biopolymer transport system component
MLVTAQAGLAGRAQLRPTGIAAGVFIILGAVAAGFVFGRRTVTVPEPAYTRLNFRRGYVSDARFAPDGRTVIYSAMLEGKKDEIFSATADSPESRPLGIRDFYVDAVSRTGELVIHTAPRTTDAAPLFRVPESGGSPRPVLENAVWADWTPDGKDLAVVTAVAGQQRVEYPIGHVLFQTNGWISNLRFSPDGKMLAFMLHPQNSFAGSVDVVDLKGSHRVLSSGWISEYGLAWSATGNEIWFTATTFGHAYSLFALTLTGKRRFVTRGAGTLTLHDIAPDGRALLTRDSITFGIEARPANQTKEVDLAWMDTSLLADISRDGRLILFGETGEGGGEHHSVYIRSVDGSAPVRLGDGDPLALSPDGKWALSYDAESPKHLVLLPTGAGEAVTVNLGAVDALGWPAWWSRNGKTIYFDGSEAGHGPRIYMVRVAGGVPRAFLAEGMLGYGLSQDYKFIAATNPSGGYVLCPLEVGSPRPISGIVAGDQPLMVSEEGQFLYVQNGLLPAQVFRLDLNTGKRISWGTFMPPDPAGVTEVFPILPSSKGGFYVYGYERITSDLYVVTGLN